MHNVFFSWSKQNGGLMMECGFRQCGWDSLPSGDGSMSGVTLLRSPVYPCGTQLPFWGVLCAHVTQLPCWGVPCIHVGQLPCWECPVYPRGTQLPYWAYPVYLRGRQLPCWGVLCAHMGDSYPAEGGLRMHTCHSLIVILLLLQHGWIWAKNHFLKQPEDICIEDPPAEDVTEERNSNCSPHSKTGSQGPHRPIMCGSQWVLASATTSSWGSRVRFHIHAGVLGRAGHLVSMTSLAAMHPFQDSRFLSHLLWLVDQMARKGDCWLEASFGAWPRAHHWV